MAKKIYTDTEKDTIDTVLSLLISRLSTKTGSKFLSGFICLNLNHLLNIEVITNKVYTMVNYYIVRRKPTKDRYSNFFNHHTFYQHSHVGNAWWEKSSSDQRVKYLEQLKKDLWNTVEN